MTNKSPKPLAVLMTIKLLIGLKLIMISLLQWPSWSSWLNFVTSISNPVGENDMGKVPWFIPIHKILLAVHCFGSEYKCIAERHWVSQKSLHCSWTYVLMEEWIWCISRDVLKKKWIKSWMMTSPKNCGFGWMRSYHEDAIQRNLQHNNKDMHLTDPSCQVNTFPSNCPGSSSPAPNPKWSHPPNLTDAEWTLLIDNEGCFKCHCVFAGHHAFEGKCKAPNGHNYIPITQTVIDAVKKAHCSCPANHVATIAVA